MRYILADEEITEDLKTIAEQEQKALMGQYVQAVETLQGKGAEKLKAMVDQAKDVRVPQGRRDQAQTSLEDVVEILRTESLEIRQVLPGLIGCIKPLDQAGRCTKAGQPPNVARCSAECDWQVMFPAFEDHARLNVQHALEHLKQHADNPLMQEHFKATIRYWTTRFPQIRTYFLDHPYMHVSGEGL